MDHIGFQSRAAVGLVFLMFPRDGVLLAHVGGLLWFSLGREILEGAARGRGASLGSQLRYQVERDKASRDMPCYSKRGVHLFTGALILFIY